MRFFKPGRLLVYILLGRFVWTRVGSFLFVSGASVLGTLDTTVTVKEGQSFVDVFEVVSNGAKHTKLKWYAKNNASVLGPLQPGSYVFSGSYTFQEFFDQLSGGPDVSYISVTLLEGWSSYDTDKRLTDRGYIQQGEYLDFVRNEEVIRRYQDRYDFLADVSDLVSLEGYLYPETYFIDHDKDFVDQLVFLQLETYNKNVWVPYGDDILGLSSRLATLGYEFSLSSYGALKLASIIEKEEGYDPNKPDIASVFFNRLDTGARLDADISLCYGLRRPYFDCSPQVIVQHLKDSSNVYNTRAVGGLPPTPIANIHVSSIKALLDAEPSDRYFYLHDTSGQIHLSENIGEHNIKKSKYLQ